MRDRGLRYIPINIQTDYVFGGYGNLGGEVLNKGLKWPLPKAEYQNLNGIETYGCTLFATTSAVEILIKYQYGEEINLSDRFLSKVSGISIGGGSPHNSAEWLRKLGAPEESSWPFSTDIDTRDKYFAELSPKLFEEARTYFLDRFDFKHEYVNPAQIKSALRYSPLGVSVAAWSKEDDRYYKPEGQRDNHWTVLLEYQDQGYEKENYQLVFDSYADNGEPLKKLRLDFQHEVVKRYWISKRTRPLSLRERFFRFWT